MGIGAFVESFNWVTKRIDQVSKFIKKKTRRGDVQGFDKAVDDRNDSVVNDKLSNLKQKAKTRDDSR